MPGVDVLHCVFCRSRRPLDLHHPFCPQCGEPLLCPARPSAKRFHTRKEFPLEVMEDFLPLARVDPGLSLGEGNTPLLRLRNIENKLGLSPVYAKNEAVNPTFSFKDRGTVLAVHAAAERNMDAIGTVSTGNMAASTAAYGARAGWKTVVLVKEDVSPEKLLGIRVYGASLFKVRGDYGELFRKSFVLGRRQRIYFMNSVDPFRIEGYKVTGLEIFLQLGRKPPAAVLLPVSSGGHMIGLIKAFQELEEAGFIERRPWIVGVQAGGCSPVARAFEAGSPTVRRIRKAATVAQAISNPDPPGGNLLLHLAAKSGDAVTRVPEESILQARKLLAEEEGIFIQPASAVPLAALSSTRIREKAAGQGPVVLVLTGSGLKAPQAGKGPSLPPVRTMEIEKLPQALESR